MIIQRRRIGRAYRQYLKVGRVKRHYREAKSTVVRSVHPSTWTGNALIVDWPQSGVQDATPLNFPLRTLAGTNVTDVPGLGKGPTGWSAARDHRKHCLSCVYAFPAGTPG